MYLKLYQLFKYHFNTRILILDELLILVSILVLALSTRKDIVIITIYFLIIPYLIFTKRSQLLKPLVVTTIISLAWMGISKEMYNYGLGFIYFFGINSFALFSWSVGLFASYIIYLHFEKLFEKSSFLIKLFFFSIFYIIALLFLEWFFNNILGIRNQMTLSHPPLFICNCLHAPIWMQISYLGLGPLFFSIMRYIKFKNPHFKKIKE
ncbi:MAG: hypothetical protein LAT82_05605 [Nanoarchaeota archaeon]|nr:hypothetical protein [Nanoarchaeota archaeon]